MHGGRATGPRTEAGLARSKRARWTHGRFSAEARKEAAYLRELLRECKEIAHDLGSPNAPSAISRFEIHLARCLAAL